jgi:hypothetical protein
MTEFTSDVKTIFHNDEVVFHVLSDLSKLELIKDQIPADKIRDFAFDSDSCSFRVDPVGEVKFRIVDREPNKLVKFKSENLPFEVFPLDPVGAEGRKGYQDEDYPSGRSQPIYQGYGFETAARRVGENSRHDCSVALRPDLTGVFPLQKEDTCPGNADHCPDHLADGNLFIEHDGRRHNDKNGNQSHQRSGNAGVGVLHGK